MNTRQRWSHTGGTFKKLSNDAIFVVCSHTFAPFWLRTGVSVEIFRLNFHVFLCACPTVISSIFGKSFHFPFHYFVLFAIWYFPSLMVWNCNTVSGAPWQLCWPTHMNTHHGTEEWEAIMEMAKEDARRVPLPPDLFEVSISLAYWSLIQLYHPFQNRKMASG